MIRKAIIVVLTLAAVSAAVIGVRSYMAPITGEIQLGNNDRIYADFNHGFCRLCWFRSEGEMLLVSEPITRLYILVLLDERISIGPGGSIRIASHHASWFRQLRFAPGGPPVYVASVRTRMWAVTVLFAAYPIVAFIRGPLRRYRRRKRGLCVKCGYNLTGLTEPRCPECGTTSERR